MKHELENIDEIYREAILELYRHPLNKKKMEHFDVHHREHNPLCGDEIELFLKFDAQGRVTDVGFWGEGCAISQASASVVTDRIKGLFKNQLLSITREDILNWLGLEKLNPTRQRCALLILKTLHKSLE